MIQKAGVGFDHKRLDSLILASDVEGYFIQYLGRCMRTEEVEPVIFDIVDNQNTLRKHFSTRQKVYFEHGGEILKFSKSFPEFEVI
jgi:superfamily II DNA or RNA helicase